MKTYRVEPYEKGWKVSESGLFGASFLEGFRERQGAIDYAKELGDRYRPSEIKIFDAKGVLVYRIPYGSRPRRA